ncbi:hypothetical protein QYF36_020420 [Acer negundo]|nr:hypothetical protein QYF36_020420 [Acer negundo]
MYRIDCELETQRIFELCNDLVSEYQAKEKGGLGEDIETGGETASTKGPVEVTRLDSVGRLSEFMEAKIVDPITGEALFPDQKGELWLRGPTIMKVNTWRQLICHSYTIHVSSP